MGTYSRFRPNVWVVSPCGDFSVVLSTFQLARQGNAYIPKTLMRHLWVQLISNE